MAGGVIAPTMQFSDASTVTCLAFQAGLLDEPMPPRFAFGDYRIAARGQSTPTVTQASGETPGGLRFDGQGFR